MYFNYEATQSQQRIFLHDFIIRERCISSFTHVLSKVGRARCPAQWQGRKRPGSRGASTLGPALTLRVLLCPGCRHFCKPRTYTDDILHPLPCRFIISRLTPWGCLWHPGDEYGLGSRTRPNCFRAWFSNLILFKKKKKKSNREEEEEGKGEKSLQPKRK